MNNQDTQLKKNKLCQTCSLVSKNKQAYEDLFDTTYYNPRSKTSLKRYSEYYKMPYDSVKNHVKKHQFISKELLTKKIEEKVEQATQKKQIRKLVTHSDIRQTIMDRGLKEIEEGKIKLDGRTVLSAAKDQKDYELQSQNQQIKMMEMMWHFASGESNESVAYDRALIESEEATSFDPTQELTRDN